MRCDRLLLWGTKAEEAKKAVKPLLAYTWPTACDEADKVANQRNYTATFQLLVEILSFVLGKPVDETHASPSEGKVVKDS